MCIRDRFWTSKYGTLSAAGYDIGITDGMNEAGLVANLLFLPDRFTSGRATRGPSWD